MQRGLSCNYEWLKQWNYRFKQSSLSIWKAKVAHTSSVWFLQMHKCRCKCCVSPLLLSSVFCFCSSHSKLLSLMHFWTLPTSIQPGLCEILSRFMTTLLFCTKCFMIRRKYVAGLDMKLTALGTKVYSFTLHKIYYSLHTV